MLFALGIVTAFSHQVLLYKFLSHPEPTQSLRSDGKSTGLEGETPEFTPCPFAHKVCAHRPVTNFFTLCFLSDMGWGEDEIMYVKFLESSRLRLLLRHTTIYGAFITRLAEC